MYIFMIFIAFLISLGSFGLLYKEKTKEGKKKGDIQAAEKICAFQEGRFVYRDGEGDILFKDKVILSAEMAKAKGFCQ